MYFRIVFGLMLVMDGLWWRRADARLRSLPWARLWRTLLALFIATMILCMLCFMAAPGLLRRAHGFLPLPLHAMVYLWHLLVMPITWILLLAGEAGRAAILKLRAPRPRAVAESGTTPALPDATLSRRQLLGAAASVAPPIIAAGMTGFGVSELGQFRVRQLDLPIPNLPPDLDGLRIAHVSDVHVGKFTVPGMLSRVVDATNRNKEGQRPHLVLLSGDLIDLSITDLPAGLDFVRKLDPLHGVAMCEGNHDLIDDPLRFYREVRSAGIPLLLDDEMTLALPGRPTPVQLLGLRWGTPGANVHAGGERAILPAMQRLLPLRRADAFPILLAHHPHAFDPAAAAGLPLTLSGHTHGGQITVAGRVGLGALIYRYWSGLYQKGDSRLLVSNGVGNWFPLRINTPAEVIHLTLRRR